MNTIHSSQPRVAVLYQALEPPLINGVRKPKKPGGYQDSGADIAFVLREQCGIPVVTPLPDPHPARDEGWCYPDTESGILQAIKDGANCLWANTILFSDHPLQTSPNIGKYATRLTVVGQPPHLVQAYDDKNFVNSLLRTSGRFTMPSGCAVSAADDIESALVQNSLHLPIVAKPIRGRGSQGVKVCKTLKELRQHVAGLGSDIMLEEFLSGTEGTVTVMPPSRDRADYWAMPIVVRFNHENDIAPYNGVVAVATNSRVIEPEELDQDVAFAQVTHECEGVARLLRVKAPIRIDVRKRTDTTESQFVLFDVNMKPNMTAPGRPGRDDQSSLTVMAASAIGWKPAQVLEATLRSASTLQALRDTQLPLFSK